MLFCVCPHCDLPSAFAVPPQVVALKDAAFTNPELAVVHAPLAALPVAFPRDRFLQVRGFIHGSCMSVEIQIHRLRSAVGLWLASTPHQHMMRPDMMPRV